MPFSNVVHMHTPSLVPKPKTTVICLGVRHEWSLPIVIAKAYAVGIANMLIFAFMHHPYLVCILFGMLFLHLFTFLFLVYIQFNVQR